MKNIGTKNARSAADALMRIFDMKRAPIKKFTVYGIFDNGEVISYKVKAYDTDSAIAATQAESKPKYPLIFRPLFIFHGKEEVWRSEHYVS